MSPLTRLTPHLRRFTARPPLPPPAQRAFRYEQLTELGYNPRMRRLTATFDIKSGDEVIVETGRRITARHILQLQKAGITRLEVPKDFLYGETLAHDLVDKAREAGLDEK